MVVRDTNSMKVAYKFLGESQMLLLSTDILLFIGKDFNNDLKLGLINFTHNEKCERVDTLSIKTMPVGYYADRGEKIFKGDHIKNIETGKKEFTIYFSSKNHMSFRNIISGDNFFTEFEN